MELENIIMSEVSRSRKTKAMCFLSYVEDRPNTIIRNIIYAYKYVQNMYPKVGLVKEAKRRGKEGKEDEIYHVCVGKDARKHNKNS
jgi:hypothetical protein